MIWGYLAGLQGELKLGASSGLQSSFVGDLVLCLLPPEKK